MAATAGGSGPVRELRIALVCYGGVSLAIYMHGVTRELHRLVVASSRFDEQGNPFEPPCTEHVYWDLLHELELFGALLDGLAALPAVTTYGRAARRTATAYFTVAGRTPREVAEHLAARKVNVWNGHNYAWELTGALGVRDAGGAVRAGLVHYNTRREVERLLDGLAELRG
jgi:hypothetical protein